jgi:dimethylaniline monooxygenase (N-oxide forming)
LLRSQVVTLRPVKDFALTGRWEAQILNKNTNEGRTEVFDAVMICTGHHAKKYMPCFKGEDNFKGTRTHTHDFRDSSGYEDKRVVVIGIGNSGGDVANELSRVSSQVRT